LLDLKRLTQVPSTLGRARSINAQGDTLTETPWRDRVEELRRTIGTLLRGRRGDEERWSQDSAHSAAWADRTAILARYIEAPETVLDVGCGLQELRNQIPGGCRYIPLDMTARSADTIVCDLAQEPRPRVRADWCVVSGVLEYIGSELGLLKWCAECAPRLAISYAPARASTWKSRIGRMRTGWISCLTEPQFLQVVRAAGYEITGQTDWHGHICVWASL
jgi:hypothetical protein